MVSGEMKMGYSSSQSTQSVDQWITGVVNTVTYDYTALQASGGSDARALLGLNVEFYDDLDQKLGSLKFARVSAHYTCSANTTTAYCVYESGAFDGVERTATIDAADLLATELTDVAIADIAKTKVQFFIAAGWCGSTTWGTIDDVTVAYTPSSGSCPD